jgi:hypothetical protein
MPEMLKSYKVRTTVRGVVFTINGKEFELGPSASSVAFEIDRAARGYNAPEQEKTVDQPA